MNVWHWWKCRRKNKTFNKEQLTIALRKVCFEEKFKNRSTNGRRTPHLYAGAIQHWFLALCQSSVCLQVRFLLFPCSASWGWFQTLFLSLPYNGLEVGWISGKLKGRSKEEARVFLLFVSRDFSGWGIQLWLWVMFPSPFPLFPSLMLRLPPATVFQLLPPSL